MRAGRAIGGLTTTDDLDYLHEFEHITLAGCSWPQMASAIGPMTSDRRGERLLERLLDAAEAGGRTGSVIDILVVQALAHQARGDATAASRRSARAVDLAEPEGYVRAFVG